MRLSPGDAALLARIIDDRSPELEVSPHECALLDRLTADRVELSPAEAALAAKIVVASIPDSIVERVRLFGRLFAGS